MTDYTSWPLWALAFTHDAARCLALIHQGQLRLDARGRLRVGSMSRLAEAVSLTPATPHPRSEAQAPELSFLVGLLGQAGLIGAVENQLGLTATTYDWLGLPAPLQVGALRQVWWLAPGLNVRWLPAARRQHPLEGYWKRVVLATCQWVTGLSPNNWTRITTGETYLAGQLTAQSADKAHNLPSVRRARQRRVATVVRFLLRFVLPVLALVDVSPAPWKLDEEDQEPQIRPMAEGLAWLRTVLAQDERQGDLDPQAAVETIIPSASSRVTG